MKITLVLILCTLMIGVTACSLNDNGQPLTKSDDREKLRGDVSGDNVSPYNYNGDYYSDRLSMGTDGLQADELTRFNKTNTNEEAKKMADAAAKIKGVDDATIVIAGGNVYVALDLDNQVQSNQAYKVENEVYDKLSKLSGGNRIMITSDDDLYGRLRDVGDGIDTGTPINKYDDDFRLFDRNFRYNVR
ncbi:MAG: YhcN/YlaJ family sporulation lipoprotein [Vulcanibacillus sp.]